jgi:N-acetylmuramoyl-L-alanine amidase
MGATVVMNRTGDTLISADTRIRWLKELAPTLCIALHHNGSTASYVNGCGTYHYNAYSSPAAKAIHSQISNSGVYRKSYLEWHYYYLARQSVCPVVLIENGYITNPEDFAAITDHNANVQKAQAIARGVADYFRSIQ